VVKRNSKGRGGKLEGGIQEIVLRNDYEAKNGWIVVCITGKDSLRMCPTWLLFMAVCLCALSIFVIKIVVSQSVRS
jgi:hypothetical protein